MKPKPTKDDIALMAKLMDWQRPVKPVEKLVAEKDKPDA